MTKIVFLVIYREGIMARSFSEHEKEHIKENLIDVCRQSWTQYGYKKTSIDELCNRVGISKGAFYLFFESKEALFCEVLCLVQRQIYDKASEIIENHSNKYGIVQALKFIYREYEKNNFLYQSDSSDFTILMNKLSKEQAEKIQKLNTRNQQLFLDYPYLKIKVDEAMVISVIYSAIMNIKYKDVLPYNHMEVFDFMVEHLVDSLYE